MRSRHGVGGPRANHHAAAIVAWCVLVETDVPPRSPAAYHARAFFVTPVEPPTETCFTREPRMLAMARTLALVMVGIVIGMLAIAILQHAYRIDTTRGERPSEPSGRRSPRTACSARRVAQNSKDGPTPTVPVPVGGVAKLTGAALAAGAATACWASPANPP